MLVSHAAIIDIVTQCLTSPAPLPGPTMLCGEHWSISWWDKKRWVVIMSTKWLLCIHYAVVFKTKILHFKVKDSVKTHSKKESSEEPSFFFLWTMKAFITKSSSEKFNLVFMAEQIQIVWIKFRYILYTMVITCLFIAVNALATSPDDDMDVILNHVPLSPSSTIPPNSPGTSGTPGTPVTPTTPVTPGVGTKISLVIVIQTCYWILVKR